MKELIIILFLLLTPLRAWDPPEAPKRDILPEKGQVTKNIHVVFDKSGSMTAADYANGYKELHQILMQSVDEYNVSLTVFGERAAHIKPRWHKMPSKKAYDKLFDFVKTTDVGVATYAHSAFWNILKENRNNLTVILITDGEITDIGDVINLLKVKGRRKFTLGVIDTDGYSNTVKEDVLYLHTKSSGGWWIDLKEEKDE